MADGKLAWTLIRAEIGNPSLVPVAAKESCQKQRKAEAGREALCVGWHDTYFLQGMFCKLTDCDLPAQGRVPPSNALALPDLEHLTSRGFVPIVAHVIAVVRRGRAQPKHVAEDPNDPQ